MISILRPPAVSPCWATYASMPCRQLSPITAFGPVIGPTMPIFTVSWAGAWVIAISRAAPVEATWNKVLIIAASSPHDPLHLVATQGVLVVPFGVSVPLELGF